MYTILSSNILKVKETNGQDAKSNEISVAVMMEDLENGVENPIFYATRYGMLYNPHADFTPNIPAGQKIKGQHVEDYYLQLAQAKEEYKRRLDKIKAGGTSSNNSAEIEALKAELKEKDAKIRNQAAKIATANTNANTGQTERMEALIEMQAAMVKQMSLMKPKVITVKIGDKENKVNAEVLHSEYETIIKLLSKKRNVFLTGPAGTGKSKLAEQVADGLGLRFYPESAVQFEHKLTGYKDANGQFHETAFYQAFKNGGLFMIDEIDASSPEVLVVINSAIAQKYFTFHGELVKAHENFRIIVAGNTTGNGADMQYTGRFQIDKSTIDRFEMIHIYYEEAIELAITNDDKELVQFAHEVRRAAEEVGISILFTYRGLDTVANLQDDFELTKLLDMALLKGLAVDDTRMLARNLKLDSTNKYLKALKQVA